MLDPPILLPSFYKKEPRRQCIRGGSRSIARIDQQRTTLLINHTLLLESRTAAFSVAAVMGIEPKLKVILVVFQYLWGHCSSCVLSVLDVFRRSGQGSQSCRNRRLVVPGYLLVNPIWKH